MYVKFFWTKYALTLFSELIYSYFIVKGETAEIQRSASIFFLCGKTE